ncbi:MAG TPA: SMC-Scp complex subunit ScpB [Wenzhouxiangella sp.]|nr:SMC-Scp complex subunit ScpB [Wenzhouxiangella sp.]
MDIEYLKTVVEGALLAAGGPLNLNQLNALFPDEEKPGHGSIREALAALDGDLENRAVELTEVGSGYRIQVRSHLMPVIANLWSEKPPRYSRALLETLAIIAYRQPITRGEIEQIRGVSLSANILRTLQERDWIKVVGHRDVPGRPELLGTTRDFLDYFNLKSLDQLPTLAEIKDIDNLEPELELIHPATAEPAESTQDDQQTQPQEKDPQKVHEPTRSDDSGASEEPATSPKPNGDSTD